MSQLRFSDVISRLLEVLPEIHAVYEARVRELYAENNPDVVYGSILVEYIRSIVDEQKGIDSGAVQNQIQRAFALIEELSTGPEFETRCLAEASVLEGLLGDSKEDLRYLDYMGPETRKIARELLVKWSRKN